MTKMYDILFRLSWALGLLSMLTAVVVKLLHLEVKLTVASHTLFLVAGTLFLCALATREMQRTQ